MSNDRGERVPGDKRAYPLCMDSQSHAGCHGKVHTLFSHLSSWRDDAHICAFEQGKASFRNVECGNSVQATDVV